MSCEHMMKTLHINESKDINTGVFSCILRLCAVDIQYDNKT